MDQYLTDEKRFIPIFIFIDEAGNEIGKWGPMAPVVKAYTDELKKDIPPKDAADYEEKFKVMIGKTSKRFTEDVDLWHDVYLDIKKTIEESNKYYSPVWKEPTYDINHNTIRYGGKRE